MQMHKSQLEQQHQLPNAFFFFLMRGGNRIHELIKPDPFDDASIPSAWLDFYKYAACGQNQWASSSGKVKNFRLFLTGNAKKWYELRILHHENNSWECCKSSFLTPFEANPVYRWHRAIFCRQRSSIMLEYTSARNDDCCI